MDAQDAGTMEDLGTESRSELRDSLNQANERFQTFSSNARQNAEATWEKAIDLIQENPASSLGIALLVGAGIGALITAWAKD
jgi:ElaB/YqjD/DUF883 family membrane-anchored ribosome-binding protein